MARETIFAPDVSIGDLITLAHLSALYFDKGENNPGAALRSETGATETRMRNTLMRIARAVGPVEIEGKTRRTQRPSARGRNVGAAGVIAKTIIDIAIDGETDQDAFRRELARILSELERQYRQGHFKASSEPARF